MKKVSVSQVNKKLAECNAVMSGKRRVVEADEMDVEGEGVAIEADDERVLNAIGDGLVSGMSRVEMLTGQKFDRAADAWNFLVTAMKAMKIRGKSTMMSKLRVFDRIGAERSAKKYKRSL